MWSSGVRRPSTPRRARIRPGRHRLLPPECPGDPGGLTAAGLSCFGGVNAPYIWIKTPDGMGSWDFFDRLLGEAHVVTTPGEGFGPSGEGHIRCSYATSTKKIEEAVRRIEAFVRAHREG